MSAPVIAFLGTGSMNGSILDGVLAGGADPSAVRATTRSATSAQRLAAEHPEITVLSEEDDERANLRAVDGADIVLLGVKPKGIQDLAASLAEALDPSTVVLSVAAGIDVAMLEQELPEGQPVVRSMPNTPSSVGRGVIALVPGTHAGEEALGLAKDVLRHSGTVLEVSEDQIGAITGVSGSGPAYAFFFAEALQQAGQALGLDEQTARLVAKETLAGAGELLHADDADPAALREVVTSPGGTTEQALKVFAEGGLVELTEKAVRASAEKGAAMEEQFRR